MNKVGRPTDYSEAVEKEAWAYLDDYKAKHDHPVPSVEGLAKVINRARSTVYKWAEEDDKAFSDILENIREIQKLDLTHGGLNNTLNSTITKLMLTKHGLSDKQDISHNVEGVHFNLDFGSNDKKD